MPDFVSLFFYFGIVAALYALSPGPVMKLCAHAPNRVRQGVEIVYAPLGVLCDHSRTLEHFYSWYVEGVWGVQ